MINITAEELVKIIQAVKAEPDTFVPPPWEDTFLGRESRMSEEEFWEKVGLK